MAPIHEERFLQDLKSVVLHLIKHDQALYHRCKGIVEAADNGRWHRLALPDKRKLVEELRGNMESLEEYYASYPHNWSKKRYSDFKDSFAQFYAELQGEA